MKKINWDVVKARLLLGAGLIAVLAGLFSPGSAAGFLLAFVPENRRGEVGAAALAILYLQSRLPDVFAPSGIRRPVSGEKAGSGQSGENSGSSGDELPPEPTDAAPDSGSSAPEAAK